MRFRIRFAQEETFPASVERPSFVELRPRRTGAAISFLISVTGHLMVVWVLGSLGYQVHARRSLLVSYPERALELSPAAIQWHPAGRQNDPTSTGASSGSAQSSPTASPGIRAAGQSAARGGEAAAVPEAPAAEAAAVAPPEPLAEPQRRQFQLPPIPVRKKERQILIQQDLPPDLALKAKIVVPELLLWHLPTPPKPKPEPIVVAHRAEEPVVRRETPLVPPQLTPRNREQPLATLRHAAAPVILTPPAPLPVANTTPIRLPDGVAGTRLPPSAGPVVSAPETLNVISIPDVAVPQARTVVLPPGNQSGLPAQPGTGGEGAGRGATGPGSGSPSGRVGSGAGTDAGSRSGQPGGGTDVGSKSGQPGAGRGSGGHVEGTEVGKGLGTHGEGTGGANGSGGHGEGTNGSRDGSGSAVAGGGFGGTGEGTIGGQQATSPPPAGATRIVRPRDGKYSVVVLGSSTAYPDAEGVLSGKLVYTVYIRAGGRKEWILQYCLPKAVEQAVKLRGSAVPLEAPYPFLIYHPSLTLQSDPEYVMVHGFITAAGKFEHLTALGEIDAASTTILVDSLQHWEFRPASRDGEPSAVEILLIIPREPV